MHRKRESIKSFYSFTFAPFPPPSFRLSRDFPGRQPVSCSRPRVMTDAASSPRKNPRRRPAPLLATAPPVSQKVLADHLGLSPATVSLVINRSPAAASIPQETKDRILTEARRLNYRPNFAARSLRKQRSFTIGVVVPEISEGYAALVMSGIEDQLLQEGYFYFVVSHRHRPDLLEGYPKLLLRSEEHTSEL